MSEGQCVDGWRGFASPGPKDWPSQFVKKWPYADEAGRTTLQDMKQRIGFQASPGAYEAKMALENYLEEVDLDNSIKHLCKVRASQINACAFCIDMHWKNATKDGEKEQRLYGLSAWQESPYYSEQERAALTWTEALTRLDLGHVPDEAYEQVRAHFNEKQISDLSYLIASINSWNRLCVAFRSTAGNYQA